MRWFKYLFASLVFISVNYANAAEKLLHESSQITKYTPYIVTVGDNGTILTSQDGVTWTPRASNSTNTLANSVYDGQDQIVTVGANATISYSNDGGVTWNIATNTPNAALAGITFNGTNYLLLENAQYDRDRISSTSDSDLGYWSGFGQQNNLLSNSFRSIVYSGNQHYVAVGDTGQIYTATGNWEDNVLWQNQTSNTYNNLHSVVYDGKQYITVGDKGIILTSKDSITWIPHPANQFNINYYGVTFSDNLYVVVGDNATIITSPDGVKWTSSVVPVSKDIILNSVDYNGKQFIVVGSQGTILTSADGTTWTQQQSGTKENLNNVLARTVFAALPRSNCPSYFDTSWIGPQMGGDFHFFVARATKPSDLNGGVSYYNGDFGSSMTGNCVDNFADNTVILTFNSNTSIRDSITLKASGRNSNTLTIISGSMANRAGTYSSIGGELAREAVR